jgi:SecD/SecF fusion protein
MKQFLVTVLFYYCGFHVVNAQDDSLQRGLVIYECFDRFSLKEAWGNVVNYMNSDVHAEPIQIKNLLEETGDYPFAYVKQENMGKIDPILNLNYVKQLFPSDIQFLWTLGETERYTGKYFGLYAIKKTGDSGVITEKNLISIHVDFNEVNQLHTLILKMNPEGTERWKDVTERSLGKVLVMVVDKKVLSAPRVYTVITEGITEISGTFTKQEIEELAEKINSQIKKE